jgi:hypothetical protein
VKSHVSKIDFPRQQHQSAHINRALRWLLLTSSDRDDWQPKDPEFDYAIPGKTLTSHCVIGLGFTPAIRDVCLELVPRFQVLLTGSIGVVPRNFTASIEGFTKSPLMTYN